MSDKEKQKSTLTPDDDFERVISWVVNEIKKEAFATPSDEYISVTYQTGEGAPKADDQRRAIKFLEKEGAIKIARTKYPFGMMSMSADFLNAKPIGFNIELLQPKFDELLGIKPKSPEVNFNAGTSTLHFNGTDIEISKTKNSDPHYLLIILFKDKGKDWSYDEIWENPYFRSREDEYNPKGDWRKMYNAGYSVNEKVAKETTIKDFLYVTKTSVSINKKYIK